MQLVLQERPPQFSLHEALALRGVLPVGEADFFNDIVDVRHDALDDDVRGARSHFSDQAASKAR